MHVLIIPGEELNETNQLSSVFEIHQAQALSDLNVKVGFISSNLKESIYKKIVKEIKKFNIRIDNRIQTKIQLINKNINLVESCGIYKTPSFLNLYRKEHVSAGLIAFKKYVQQFGKPDIIHAHSRFLNSVIIANKIYSQYNIPYVFTEHSSYHQRELVNKGEYKIYQKLICDTKKWIVVSESLGSFILNKMNQYKFQIDKSFLVLPNVLDSNFSRADNSERKIGQNRKFTFINIASLDSNKNHNLLIDSFVKCYNRNNDIELKIVGEGPQYYSLQKRISSLGIKNISLLGKLNRDEVIDELKNAHAFVLSSNIETFGVVLIEAMSLGKPVISTRCGGPNDIVNELNGILVEPNSIQEFANSMSYMIDNYSKYNAEAISKTCIENYGPETIGKKLIQIYKEALN